MSSTGLLFRTSLCAWLSFCRCLTVSSRMSAFSSFDTFSPSACRHPVMMSLSSSRQALILALLFRSRRGLVIFLYCIVLDIGASSSVPAETFAVVADSLTASSPPPRPYLAKKCWCELISLSLYSLVVSSVLDMTRLVFGHRCCLAMGTTGCVAPGRNQILGTEYRDTRWVVLGVWC